MCYWNRDYIRKWCLVAVQVSEVCVGIRKEGLEDSCQRVLFLQRLPLKHLRGASHGRL